MYLGVDYYPEHWPKDMMEEDMQGIKMLGSNMVRIGEFAWHLMEKEEGKFDFTYFDEVIVKLKEKGLKVMFGTPTATFPAWLAHKYPSILAEDSDGNTRVFGGRRQYCFSSDIYRTYSKRISEELVKHYRNEESIVAWQIDNEFGHEGSDMCYCDQCHNGFKKFLQDKYETIDRLNDIYGTIFWGQTYNHFEEIPIPKKTITTHNPSLQLDWARFRSFTLNRFANEQTDIVRKYKGEHQLVTTNVSGGFFSKWFDHEENVKNMDFVSFDNYPVWGGLEKPKPEAEIALDHDFNRGLLNKNFWIVEELMGAQGHTVIGYLPRPNQGKMWSYQAFAHGCTDMLYFRWRGMTKGAEQFCYGVVDHDNSYGRKYKEVQTVFQEIPNYEEVLHSTIDPKIAVLYDYDNIWSWRFQQQSYGFDFLNEVMRLYTPFYNYNTQMDVIPVTRDFSNYKILVVPVMQIVDEALAKRFDEFVKLGGTLIFSFRTGIKNKHNNVHFKQTLPGFVADMAGIRVHEVEALSASTVVPVVGEGEYAGIESSCTVWRDIITPVTAETLYRYDDPFFPEAAVTKNTYGKGTVYYIGGGLEEDLIEKIALFEIKKHNIKYVESEKGLEVYPRYFNQETYYFLTNHTDVVKQFKNITLEPFGSQIVKASDIEE